MHAIISLLFLLVTVVTVSRAGISCPKKYNFTQLSDSRWVNPSWQDYQIAACGGTSVAKIRILSNMRRNSTGLFFNAKNLEIFRGRKFWYENDRGHFKLYVKLGSDLSLDTRTCVKKDDVVFASIKKRGGKKALLLCRNSCAWDGLKRLGKIKNNTERFFCDTDYKTRCNIYGYDSAKFEYNDMLSCAIAPDTVVRRVPTGDHDGFCKFKCKCTDNYLDIGQIRTWNTKLNCEFVDPLSNNLSECKGCFYQGRWFRLHQIQTIMKSDSTNVCATATCERFRCDADGWTELESSVLCKDIGTVVGYDPSGCFSDRLETWTCEDVAGKGAVISSEDAGSQLC